MAIIEGGIGVRNEIERELRIIEQGAPGLGDFIIYGVFIAPWIISIRLTLGLKFRNNGIWW